MKHLFDRNVTMRPAVWSLLLVTTLVFANSGCRPIQMRLPLPETAPLAAIEEDVVGKDVYKVVIHNSWGKPTLTQQAIVRPVSLNEVLEKSGVTKKFSDMTISIARLVPKTSRVVRMKAVYNPSKKKVRDEYNYDVRAFDTVTIKPKMNMPFDDLIQPLSELAGN